MSSQDDLAEYQGRIVSQSYNVGFVALSCLVSFIGAASTLELINHRTGFRGLFNKSGAALFLTKETPLTTAVFF